MLNRYIESVELNKKLTELGLVSHFPKMRLDGQDFYVFGIMDLQEVKNILILWEYFFKDDCMETKLMTIREKIDFFGSEIIYNNRYNTLEDWLSKHLITQQKK